MQVRDEGSASVIDRGPGGPLELKERIFERSWFSRERRSSGVRAGFGLSIASEIARARPGRVIVKYALGAAPASS